MPRMTFSCEGMVEMRMLACVSSLRMASRWISSVEMLESSDEMIERRTAASRLSRSWMTGLRSELFSSSFSRRRIAEL